MNTSSENRTKTEQKLGHPVPLQLATDTILNSLSDDYKPFVVNYNMNNMEKSIAELHYMLKTAELNMGTKNKTKDVLMVRDGGVKKKHGHTSTSKGKGPVQAVQSAPKKGKGKGKGKKVKPNKARTENRCFTCNEVGHWRQNCPKRHEAGSDDQLLNNSYKCCRLKVARIFDRVANIGRDPRMRLLLGNSHKSWFLGFNHKSLPQSFSVLRNSFGLGITVKNPTEFAYNNSLHSCIGMAPFEPLYGRKCRTPTCWLEAGEKQFAGPEIIQETADKVKGIRERLKAAQDRQKSYGDKKRRPIDFQVGERCLAEEESVIPVSEIRVDTGNRCIEDPEAILESKTKKLRHKEVTMVKVQWKYHRGANVTWEAEEDMKRRYPQLFA
ncbi:hypothetical protein OSB04_031789 [Centaurea solstitialis]|uniref:CCHC-type domain-containing protein n=1 Tax=Centaurea solstitialis TaxID=347529 RepID=A0AA38SNC1_9ASTR|nr:hypothetical protein OSB04_031789 [Centaurea solstitialis]